MFLAILLTFLLTLFVYVGMKRAKKLGLPGPPGIPILGNLLQLDSYHPHEQLTSWANKYGGVYSINLMGTNWVVVSGYEPLYTMLVKNGPQFADRPRTFRINYRTFGVKNLFSQNSREHFHTTAKRTLHRSLRLHSGGIAQIDQVVSTMLESFINKIQQTKGQPHNPQIDIYNFALQSLLYFSIGRFVEDGHKFFAMGRKMERLAVAAASSVGVGSELDALPWLRFFPNKTFAKMAEARDIIIAFWKMVKPELNAEDESCVMESMLKTQQEELEQTGRLTIDEDNLKALLADILVAGTTTTSNTLTSFINIMMHYPKVQDKLHQEVDAIVGQSRTIAAMDRQKMPYTRATIYELNRYVSIVPLGVFHTAAEDCELAGTTIPKGTNLIANTWALHHDDRFWGDPWNFRPERFLDEQGGLLPADHEKRKHLLPFGAGPRVCVGEVFAMVRMFLFVASVMQHFTIKAAPGQKIPCDPRSYIFGAALSAPEFEVLFVNRM